MIEGIQGTVSSIVIESALESALLWMLALSFLRWSRVADPAVRATVFSLPLFLPVVITTIFHVLVPVRPSAVPHFKPLEAFISQSLIPFPLLAAFLLAGMVGVAASLTLAWRHRLVSTRAHRIWEQQEHDESPLRQRCNAALDALATRFGTPVPRLVLDAGTSAGSVSLVRSGYIFVPRALAERLDEEELDALLAHEIAHIVRRDGLVGSLARVCRNLMLFNPLAHLAMSKFERERERAADDLAVRMGSNRLALASCLLKAYRFGGCQASVTGTGFAGNAGALEQRVRRMIRAPMAQQLPAAVWPALGLLAGVLTIFFAMTL